MDEREFRREEWLYEGVVVTQLNIEHQEVDPVELYDCELPNAQLSGAKIKRWVFEGCIFKDSDLSNVIMESCIFDQCQFIRCRLIGSDWSQSQSRVQKLSFQGCDLSLSNFSGVDLTRAEFIDCKCLEVDFSGGLLKRCVFVNTHVTDSTFDHANLSEADVVGALGERFNLADTTLDQATVSVHTAIRLVEAMGLHVRVDSL